MNDVTCCEIIHVWNKSFADFQGNKPIFAVTATKSDNIKKKDFFHKKGVLLQYSLIDLF